MKTDRQKMLAEAYEIEGLLLLADNRGDDTPEYVYTAIGEKLDRLRTMLGHNNDTRKEAPEEAASETESAYETDHFEEETQQDVVEATVEEIDESGYFIEAQEPVVELVVTDDSADEDADEDVDEVMEPETEADVYEAEQEPTETGNGEPLRLDEKLQRSRSKDLKAAFSLNDTFRFRRELFGNSAAEMTDALHLVEAMQSFDEAEDYFYNDLGWDRESDDVKEFMAIIKNHFL